MDEKKCKTCKGTGRAIHPVTKKMSTCVDCGGLGHK